jgi:hypothetical protein
VAQPSAESPNVSEPSIETTDVPQPISDTTDPSQPPTETMNGAQHPTETADAQPLVHSSYVRPLAIGALSAAAGLVGIFVVVGPPLTSTELPLSSAAIAKSPTPEASTAPRLPATPETSVLPQATTTTDESRRDGVRDDQITAAAPVHATVIKARLCADLEQWRCDPPDRPVPSGPLFFYTQLKSTSATTVKHRWYRGDRLYQSVELRASPSTGYRTFSRQNMNSDSAGNWRVELRAEDGALLHEERFSVR